MSEKKRPERPLIADIWRMMLLVLRAAPAMNAAHVVSSMVHASSFALVYITMQRLFDAATALASGGPLGTAVAAAGFFGLAHVWTQALNGFDNFFFSQTNVKITGVLNTQINDKASRIAPVTFEDPAFLDDVNKAREGAGRGIFTGKILITIATFYLPYFATMGGYLYSLSPLLLVSLALVFLPVIASQVFRLKVFAKLEDEVAPVRRRMEYYEQCLTDRQYFKETRMLGAFTYFMKLTCDAAFVLGKTRWKAEATTQKREAVMRLFTLVGYLGILGLLVSRLLAGVITVGAFAAVLSSVGMLFGVAEEIISRHVGQVARTAGTMRNFLNFLDMPERGGSLGEFDAEQGLSLQDVRFAYPGAQEEAIRGVSLTIAAGETVAIVGANGAGKSTLVKLMTGLYAPTSGRVLVGGLDTAGATQDSVFRGVSAVQQKYQRYRMTLLDNVALSQPDVDSGEAKARAQAACGRAELQLGPSFPDGMDTMLSREFDGVDLSGGEWQRVAIARGLYRTHELIVLDEPTAAIDPIEETRVYRQFAEMSRGKTAVIVTHRLGSARITGRIVVMDGGRVDDTGTHEQLMARGGLYAQMFAAQRKWYEAGPVQEERAANSTP